MVLGYIIGLVIVLIALSTVLVMFWAIMREPHAHEEHYIPPEDSEPAETPAPANHHA